MSPRPSKGQRAPDLHAQFNAYVLSHLRAFFFSLGKLYRAPMASLMTLAVIGIALALPTALYLTLSNLQAVSGQWKQATQISLFLKQNIDDAQALALGKQLRQRTDVGDVQIITRAQALAEFRELSGFGAALDALQDNPLPAVLIVYPAMAGKQPLAVSALVDALRVLPQVDIAQLDMQWVQRLYAIMDTAQRGVWVIAVMLGLAVLLVVGNTIRLDIQNRRDEIEVTKLIGGTDGFIRRPFLYGGLWYGLLGGLMGLLIVEIALGLLARPVQRLTRLYESQYQLMDLDLSSALTILLFSALLGLAGSWLAVGRHLSEIEPR